MTTSNFIVSSHDSLPIQQKLRGRGNKIVVGTVVKSKMGEFEEEVRAGHLINMRKEVIGVVQLVVFEEEVIGEVSGWVQKESVLE